jgi:hypothetical protein
MPPPLVIARLVRAMTKRQRSKPERKRQKTRPKSLLPLVRALRPAGALDADDAEALAGGRAHHDSALLAHIDDSVDIVGPAVDQDAIDARAMHEIHLGGWTIVAML